MLSNDEVEGATRLPRGEMKAVGNGVLGQTWRLETAS